MANCILKDGADLKRVRREMKKKGFVLRAYRQPDGTYRYTLRKNTYRHENNN